MRQSHPKRASADDFVGNEEARLFHFLRRRKNIDQECLELSRFLNNVHPFARGKHHQPSQPPELVDGLHVPEYALTLLGLAPKW